MNDLFAPIIAVAPAASLDEAIDQANATPFGGWKRSGTGGKAGGGPYYLQQYLREQSRTIVG